MAQWERMTLGNLADIRQATAEKLAVLQDRQPSKRAEVNAGFDKVEAALQLQIADIDAELARRASVA